MRVKGYTLQQFLLGAALVFALAYNLAHASEIKGLVLEQGATGTRANSCWTALPNSPRCH